MKYYIQINQLAAFKNFGIKIDFIDLAIFDYCKDFISSQNKNIKRIEIDGQLYTWINYEHLIKNMPLLKIISKDPIYKRILKLVKFKLLKKETFNNNMPVFRLGEKADCLIFENEAPLQEIDPSIYKNEPPPFIKMDNYNYINNNNKINNIYGEYKNIKLSDKEYEKLKEKYPTHINDIIEYLSAYKVEKSYKTKSDYLTILRWVADAVLKAKTKYTFMSPKDRVHLNIMKWAKEQDEIEKQGGKNDTGETH